MFSTVFRQKTKTRRVHEISWVDLSSDAEQDVDFAKNQSGSTPLRVGLERPPPWDRLEVSEGRLGSSVAAKRVKLLHHVPGEEGSPSPGALSGAAQ